jgi:HSP20 family protein
MRSYWSDLERTFAAMEDFRRRVDRALGGAWDYGYGGQGGWPAVNMYDAGNALTVTAEVPGLSEKEIQLTVNQNVLTISGERKSDVPEGYSVHRQERTPYRFSRSFSLPVRVAGDKTSATLKNGILTITLEKAPEAQPRQIAVKAS